MTLSPRRLIAVLSIGLAVAMLGGCLTTADAPTPPLAPPVAAGTTEPLRFGELSLGSMRRGMEIGRHVWDIDCAPPYDEVYWTSGAGMRRGATFDERFAEAMTGAGFDVVGRPGGPDSPGGNLGRARFTVQGDLRDVKLELCRRTNWLTGADKGVSGTGSARVDWSVYDARSGRLVHRVSTSGIGRQERGVPQGDTLLVEEAFAAATERLAADPGFQAVLARGAAVTARVSSTGGASPVSLTPRLTQSSPPLVDDNGPETPRLHAALTIRTPPTDGSATEDPTTRAGAARLRVGQGHGLVIGEVDGETGRESVLLVPDAPPGGTVAVRPARGVVLTGIVEGRDAASGLALVRVPARLTAVPVRGGTVAVSEPVSVAMRQGSESALGIVGAIRPDPARGIDVIQADLGALGLLGASVEAGDPLLDEAGAVVGLALGPGGLSAAAPPGLAAFVPLGPLLGRLGVDLLEEGPRLRQPAARVPSHPRRSRVAVPDEELDEAEDPPT
ncbi:serine protease [Azospirillum doebereinerae]|uniref:serine protease n=1 Tax=Azospirillum doebereinerae TaxID=92933 RepID=UPI001EE4F07A|nr:serine protease [Azospirillum doebereinerae]MCG5241906.1 serine protease [Azospirillum doebereinerae]